MAQEYSSIVFREQIRWDEVPTAEIASFHWETGAPYRPKSYAQLCALAGSGFALRLWSFESPVCCKETKRDGRIWCDSCLEFFFQPLASHPAYLNFEINPKGYYLSQFGEAREKRVFLRDMTALEPEIQPFSVTENGETAWGVCLLIPQDLIAEVYGQPFAISPGSLRGNFYKCADESAHPHYGAYFPVDSAERGFHNPARFGVIRLKEEEM